MNEPTSDRPTTSEPSPRHARRRARGVWLTLTVVSAVAMAVVVPMVEAWDGAIGAWFLVPLLWLAMAVPAVLSTHAETFRAQWVAGVSPEDPAEAHEQVKGMAGVWGVLTVGVLLSLAACLITGSATPSIWPGAVMLMLLVLTGPTRPMSPSTAAS